MLWYSLEAPRLGISNEYPQHMFLWKNMIDINTFIFLVERSALLGAMTEEDNFSVTIFSFPNQTISHFVY